MQRISVRERTKTRPDVVWSRNLASRRMELTKAIADKEVRIWKTPRRPRRARKGKARSPGNFGPKGRAGRCWLAADPSGHIGGDNQAGEGRRVRHAERSPYALLFPQLACGGKFFVWFGYEMRSGWTNVRVCASPRKLIHPYVIYLRQKKTMWLPHSIPSLCNVGSIY
ncbi:uncharacterized protein LOC110111090 [Dendrobium catenatum]|uniref:uncharacterized protein LOC110111090 n=1 Tax=Dendrobium catenatum TaxID=906689 RepID=UPI0009F5171A|nr:uncharacterized protein LOC110111090 [Dendrobium catenatum]